MSSCRVGQTFIISHPLSGTDIAESVFFFSFSDIMYASVQRAERQHRQQLRKINNNSEPAVSEQCRAEQPHLLCTDRLCMLRKQLQHRQDSPRTFLL